jgi:hypothetical protein
MLSTLKKRSQKFVSELPEGICRLNPKSKKNHRSTKINQSERKFSQKNYVSYLKSVKEPKIRIGATRRNLQAQPKILQKLSEHQIYQSKRKFNQKKYV